ncbi:hypothetical protein ACWC5I_27960, partial [Kitasatospora sp. NPDC001574]
AEVEQDCSSFATLRDGRTLLPGRRLRPGGSARHWSPTDVAAARMERHTPAQVGGWGYRLSGLGTTVMLRRGECLVVRPHRGVEFAVSVDDAERGAALLNTVAARRAG